MEVKPAAFVDDLPADDAIIALEETAHGWRGLTSKCEVLDVRGRNGRKPAMPDDGDDVLQVRGGVAAGRRAISRGQLSIDDYLTHFDRGLALSRESRDMEALAELDAARALAPTLYASFNRAMVLLALGRWHEGFAEYRQCEQHAPFMRPAVTAARAAGLKLWDGEDLAGKRLLLLHAHGFGDTIMTLRYVPLLKAIGANVVLMMPAELRSLAGQLAPVIGVLLQDADLVCQMLHIPGMLSVRPEQVGGDPPYLHIDPDAIEQARATLGPGPHIGIAWSTAQRPGDYPRSIPLHLLVAALGGRAQLHSVQKFGALEAMAQGVRVHPYADFAGCAAMMLAMDRIVSIDTAAVHLAGAIGHPRVEALISRYASWRWLASWYPTVRLCRQTIADDWSTALAQLEASDG
jgi:hypothetical protein